MPEYRTPQEIFWAGEFGDAYIGRNSSERAVAANLAFFSRALQRAAPIRSCVELGANIGLNLRALRLLMPQIDQFAVEINAKAARELRQHVPTSQVFEMSMFDFQPSALPQPCDLSFVKGVLIHVNPERLADGYDKLHEASARYVLVAEYYNRTPTGVDYRGHADRLFKRDFAGELMDRYPRLELVDYGFVYHRDRVFPQDDITWFLMEKK